MVLVTVLSPHQDDGGFSLAMTIRAAASAGNPVRIVNCFTVSDHAPFAAAVGSNEVQSIRSSEDREFVSRIGWAVEVKDLEMLDAPLRLGCPVSRVRRLGMRAREHAEARRIAGLLTKL